jgi:hypothetical protein
MAITPRTASGPRTLTIDVGGSRLKASVLDARGAMLVERVRVPTPVGRPPALVIEALARLAGGARRWAGPRAGPSTHGSGAAAIAGRCRGSQSRGAASTRPDSSQRDPEKAIRCAKLGPGHRSLVDGELVAQGKVLEGELAVTAEEKGEEPKQPLAGPTRFWRRTRVSRLRSRADAGRGALTGLTGRS